MLWIMILCAFVIFERAKNVCDFSESTWYSYVRSFGYYSYVVFQMDYQKRLFIWNIDLNSKSNVMLCLLMSALVCKTAICIRTGTYLFSLKLPAEMMHNALFYVNKQTSYSDRRGGVLWRCGNGGAVWWQCTAAHHSVLDVAFGDAPLAVQFASLSAATRSWQKEAVTWVWRLRSWSLAALESRSQQV